MHDHDIPDGAVYRGHDGWREWSAHFAKAWESVSLEPQEYVDAVVIRTVVPSRIVHGGWQGCARGSNYGSPAEALEAAGLTDSAMSQDNVDLLRRLYADGGPFSLPMSAD